MDIKDSVSRKKFTRPTRIKIVNFPPSNGVYLSNFNRMSPIASITGWTRENGIKMMAFGLKDWTMGVDPFVHATTTRPSSKDRINDPVAVLKGVHSRIISAEKCEKMISYTYGTCLSLFFACSDEQAALRRNVKLG